MSRVTGLLVVAVLALLLTAPAGVSATAAPVSAGAAPVAAAQQPPSTPPANPSAPAGPNLTPEQESTRSKQKLVIGIAAALLLGIVIVGRRSHNKRLGKAEAGKSGK